MRLNGLQILFLACMALSLGFFSWGVGLAIPMARSDMRTDVVERIHHEMRFRYRNCRGYLLDVRSHAEFLTFSSCDEGGPDLTRLIKAAAEQGRPLAYATNQHGRILRVKLGEQEIDMFDAVERDRRLTAFLLMGVTAILLFVFARMFLKTRGKTT